METWRQLEFDFSPLPRKKKPRKIVNYDLLAEYVRQAGEVTFAEISELTESSAGGTAQIIDTLSLRYPLWSPRRGVYRML
jgi:hypothetical protein